MSSLSQGNTLQDVLKYEEDNNYSREVVTMLSGQDLSLAAVLGKVKLEACPTTGTAGGGNTGGGTCTGVTAGAKAKQGTYTLKCIIAQANAGVFSVEDPDGFALPDAVVGVAYTNDQINFTINDNSPDFTVSDVFTIAIPAGSLSVRAINFSGVDGSQDAYGILTDKCDASGGAKSAVAVVRNAKIVAANLSWPTGASADQKAAALAQLAAKGIIETKEV